MLFEKEEQIGKVSLKKVRADRSNAPVYSDGPIESKLYERFKADCNYGQVDNRKNYISWPEEYHLTAVRHNLLKWFPFDPEGDILEVGAGCGALTGLLCTKLKRVVALEYSYERSLVTAHRHSRCSNLEVIVGGLQDYERKEKFEYIAVIGVLEYAGTFYGSNNPYEDFLHKLRGLLKPQGKLILAIENKIGLKYITGAPEDHTARMFDSIYDYPYACKVKTFSKKELTDLLEASGFLSMEWYYPFPDYKMPQMVLSEEVNPKETDSLWMLYPAQTGGSRRKEILSERRFGKTLNRAGLFGEFANSFLVVARMVNIVEEPRCIRFWGANQGRKPEYRTHLQVDIKNRERTVVKSADSDRSSNFILEISRREILARNFFADRAEVVIGRLNGSRLYYPYIQFPTLEDLIAEAIENGDIEFGSSLIEKYRKFLLNLPIEETVPDQFMHKFKIDARVCTKPILCFQSAPLDCIPRNIGVGLEKWYIMDNEWTYDFPLPVDYLIFRGIVTLIIDLQAQIQVKVSKNQPVVLFWGHGKDRQYLPLSWLDILRTLDIPLKQLMQWETQFQNYVQFEKKHLRLRLKKNSKVFTKVDIGEIKTNQAVLFEICCRLRRVAKRFLRMF